MDNYDIENQVELSELMESARLANHPVTAVKGPPPEDAKYSDGTPCKHPVNVAWRNKVTGNVVFIRYVKQDD